MSKNIKVSLPATITVKLGSDAGEWTLSLANLSESMVAGLFTYGMRQVANDGAAGADDKAASILARIAKIESGEYVFGAGGGGGLSPWMKILRDDVSAYFQNMTKAKKAPADKAVREDMRATFESAFQVECNDIGLKVTPETAEAEFEAMTKTAQESAGRIAAAKLSDVDKRLARLTALKAATK